MKTENDFIQMVNLYRALGYRMVEFETPDEGRGSSSWIAAFDTHNISADKLPVTAFASEGWLEDLHGYASYNGPLALVWHCDVTDDMSEMLYGYDFTADFPVLQVVGTKLVFDSHGCDSQLKKYDGIPCTIIRRVTSEEADLFETGNMYVIRLDNGVETQAFEDELVLVV